MDDVSSLADRSEIIASFLTVACKFRYHSVYIFHIVFPKKADQLNGDRLFHKQIFLIFFQLLYLLTL